MEEKLTYKILYNIDKMKDGNVSTQVQFETLEETMNYNVVMIIISFCSCSNC